MLFLHSDKHRFGIRIAASACGVAICLAAAVSSTSALRAQTGAAGTAAAVSVQQAPTAADPFVALPNYAVTTKMLLLHWRQPEVVFHVTPARSDKRTPAELAALVRQGLAVWNDKISSKLTLRLTEDPNEAADVEISFVPAGSFPSGQIGNTGVSYARLPAPQNDIANAQIQLVEGLSANLLVQDVAHECGHALGIEGHSGERGDLMFPVSRLPVEISERDVNTLNIAYYQIDTGKKSRKFHRKLHNRSGLNGSPRMASISIY